MVKRLFALLLTVTLVALGITGCSDDESESGTSASRATGQSATMIRAKQGTATLEIERAQPGGTRPAEVEDNTWTVFLYLCGSDLESEQGSATEDLAELVELLVATKYNLSCRPVAPNRGTITKWTQTVCSAFLCRTAPFKR